MIFVLLLWAKLVFRETWKVKYVTTTLDIEEGAGSKNDAGQNMLHFINKLRSIKPNIIVGQPTYGYPQVIHSALEKCSDEVFRTPMVSIYVFILVSSGIQLSCLRKKLKSVNYF